MRFWARRLSFYAIAAWAAITANFALPRLMPGGPLNAVLNRFEGQLSPEAVDALSAEFGINPHQSLWDQYLSYLGNLAHGNLGTSFTYFPTPVSTVMGQSLPWTVGLLTVATLLAWLVGTVLGVVAGWRRGTKFDVILPAGAFLRAIPHFWVGLLLVTVFAVSLGWFPASGGYSPDLVPALDPAFVSSAISHAILPAAAIVIGSLAAHMLNMRNLMVTTLAEDYVVVAEAKGLRPRRIMFSYAARNAMLPAVASFALELGLVVSGALLVEKVFSFPGIGFVLFQAIHNQDYPLLQGILLVTTFAVLVANLGADLAFFALDPRTREA